jgi:hypothetical protein
LTKVRDRYLYSRIFSAHQRNNDVIKMYVGAFGRVASYVAAMYTERNVLSLIVVSPVSGVVAISLPDEGPGPSSTSLLKGQTVNS